MWLYLHRGGAIHNTKEAMMFNDCLVEFVCALHSQRIADTEWSKENDAQ